MMEYPFVMDNKFKYVDFPYPDFVRPIIGAYLPAHLAHDGISICNVGNKFKYVDDFPYPDFVRPIIGAYLCRVYI